VSTAGSLDEAVARLLGEAVAAGDVPGAVAVVGGRRCTRLLAAEGYADPGATKMLRTDSLFRLASMTKLITAVAVMRQVDAGRITLDDPVTQYLPEFGELPVLAGFTGDGEPVLRPQRAQPTVRQLLANTAGLAYEIWCERMFRYHEYAGLPSAATGILRSLTAPLVSDPGTEIWYSTGADWAGRLLESVTGDSLDGILGREVFDVLDDTEMTTTLTAAQRERCPDVLARHPTGGFTSTDVDYPGAPEFRTGGGCVYATAADFLLLQRFLLC
jgi:methyl acetate hydrolase